MRSGPTFMKLMTLKKGQSMFYRDGTTGNITALERLTLGHWIQPTNQRSKTYDGGGATDRLFPEKDFQQGVKFRDAELCPC